MSHYVIGVDIGATKSHLALFDTDGNLVDFGHWGPLNYEMLPGLYLQFEDEFRQFAMRLIAKNGITLKQVSYSVLGMGGVDTKRQHQVISGVLSRLGFEHFTLVNDAYLGIAAGIRARTGICAINGSGCTLAGITGDGKMMQIGGVGALSADKGGGGYMGEQAASAVYTELFRKGRPTLMTSLFFKKLGITDKYDYVEKIHEKTNDGSFSVNSCGRFVFEAVKQNDAVAVDILREMADNYADGISCMIEEMRFPNEEELAVVFAGSVFVKGEHPMLLDLIKAKLQKDNGAYRFCFTLLDVPNVAGAVIWALSSIDNKVDYFDKVCSQLRPVVVPS